MRGSLTMSLCTLASPFAVARRSVRVVRKLSGGGGADDAAYAALTGALREVSRLEEIEGLLSYDEQVFMSPGSAAARAAQKEALASLVHEKRTGDAMRAAVDGVRGATFADARASANARDAVVAFDRAARKPAAMAAREARLESECFGSWKAARDAADFSLFEADLASMVDLKREVALLTRPELCAVEPYDGALDAFERGATAAGIDAVFDAAERGLEPLLNAVLDAKRASPALDAPHPSLDADHPGWADVAAQAALSRRVAGDLGFDFDEGRLDVSTHPFTGGAGPRDTRITTRYSAGNWFEGFGATVHEVGHALYEQGRNAGEHGDGLPASAALSMGVHESQSLLWERHVLQGRPFWDYAAPLFHDAFPHTRDAGPEDFYRFVNRVSPGCIRVEADELTYPFHVFLRYRLERSLFDGSCAVGEIPRRWNAAMKASLDVDVKDDAAGALQDIHWSFGALGYFPSYTLGAIAAAQIFAAAEGAIPGLSSRIAAGDFAPLREWLRSEIHDVGSVHAAPDALLEAATGAALSVGPYLAHLKKRYTALYGL